MDEETFSAIYNINFDEFLETLLALKPQTNYRDIKRAYDFAKLIHQGQFRDEGTPYISHPLRVAYYLIRYFRVFDEEVIAGALLHDVLEDCPRVTIESLKKIFGARIAFYVYLLTKPAEDLLEPRQRILQYQHQLLEAPEEVKLIKLLDRLDNLFSLPLSPDPGKIEKYIKETLYLYIPLARQSHPGLAVNIFRQVKKLAAGLKTPPDVF